MESDSYFSIMLLQTMNGHSLTSGFVAALCLFFLLLGLVAFLSLIERTFCALSQEEISEAEECKTSKDKTIASLSDCPRLIQYSFRIVHCVLAMALTALCIYCVLFFDLAVNIGLLLLFAFACTLLLWLLFYGIAHRKSSSNKLQFIRINIPIIKLITNIGMPILRLSKVHFEQPDKNFVKKPQMPLADEAPEDIYEEQDMLEDIRHFYNKTANEIMTPRTEMQTIDINSPFEGLIRTIVDSGYSRIPVYEEDEDDIKGVIYAKDILPAFNKNDDFDWKSMIRKPYFVPEAKKIDDLLKEFRTNKIHMAIVVDEFGSTAGLVTMEDIIEEIVGDISDEYDEDEHSIISLADGSFILDGKIQLNDFFRETDIPASDFSGHTEDAETLTGLLLDIKETLPQRRETIDYKNYRFRILEADERRVKKVKLSILPRNEEKK